MRGRACALLAACALGCTAGSRTELEVFGVADASASGAHAGGGTPDAGLADAGAHDAACQWTFAPQVTYGAGGYPVGIAIGDFSGDGVSDILTVNGDGIGDGKGDRNSVGILTNRGDGTFAPRATFPSGLMPYGMTVGDFSGDGRLDLAIIYEYQAPNVSHAVNVFLNRGDGTFGLPGSYDINGGAYAIAAGDLNGDGHLDLAVVDATAKVSVLTNLGRGTFGPPATFNPGDYADQITLSDLDHDGALDIVTAGTFSTQVLLNQGRGAFAPPVTYRHSPACDYIGPITAGDIDGDGYPKILRSCYQFGDVIGVRANNGDGTLGSEVTYMTGSWPWGLVIGDFTGHGRNDLAVANSWAYANTVSVLPNTGSGTFGSQVTYATTTPNSIAAGDLNGDGHADIATAGAQTVSVLLSVCE